MTARREGPIDIGKLGSALGVMRAAFSCFRPLVFAEEDRVFEVALVGYGCFGTWPDLGPLELGLKNYAENLGCSEAEVFARLDVLLAWIASQQPASNRWRF